MINSEYAYQDAVEAEARIRWRHKHRDEKPDERREPNDPTSLALAYWDANAFGVDELTEIPPPSWLVEGILPASTTAMMYGPSGQYKSFVALDMAMSIATGIDWADRPTEPGHVMYVAAEGVSGIAQRVTAWRDRHQIGEAPPVTFIRGAVPLFDRGTPALFARWCLDRRPVLIIFDTLARCAVGAEENSAKDMGAIVAALDQIRDATGATVLVVHHSGKNLESGGRGSTALKGAMDTELMVTAADTKVTVRTTKQKDAEEALPIQFDIVTFGPSVVLNRARGAAVGTETTAKVLAALSAIDVPGGVTRAEWCETAEVAKPTFYRAARQLLDMGAVVQVGSGRGSRWTLSGTDE